MKSRWIGAVIALAVLVGVAYATFWYGMNQGMKMGSGTAPAPATGSGDASGRKVLYWHDPMVPGQRFDKPGKSPFMDMQLVPVYADDGGGEGGVAITPGVQQNLGIRMGEATKQTTSPVFETVGTVAYNERDVAVVQARASGFVEKLHVRATLDRVSAGQPLLDLYVPDWIAAQEEYLGIVRMKGASLESLREGAVQRMRLAGMEQAQIDRVVTTGRTQPRTTLVSPMAGVIAELQVREGMTVAIGTPLFRINGVATMWINADVPEPIAAQVRPGVPVEARTAALGEQTFRGKVGALLPEVNATTRTLKARIEIANPKGELVPGMFATVTFSPGKGREVVVVPSEAVIRTGTRNVVIVAHAGTDGRQRFTPTEVEIGSDFEGRTEIRKGIEAGTQVVVSGQFLIDSEASLKSTETRLAAGTTPAAAVHRGEGKVEAVMPAAVTLSHGPIPSMQWGSMTMDFRLPKEGVKAPPPGTPIEFEFTASPDGEYRITSIRPKPGAAPEKAMP